MKGSYRLPSNSQSVPSSRATPKASPPRRRRASGTWRTSSGTSPDWPHPTAPRRSATSSSPRRRSSSAGTSRNDHTVGQLDRHQKSLPSPLGEEGLFHSGNAGGDRARKESAEAGLRLRTGLPCSRTGILSQPMLSLRYSLPSFSSMRVALRTLARAALFFSIKRVVLLIHCNK